jgi:alpha-amylase
MKTFVKAFSFIVLVWLFRSPWAQSQNTSTPNPTNRQVVLQGFWWDYWNNNYPNGWANYLAALAPRLKEIGIDAVWVPPSIKNNSPSSVGYAPFDHYDLGDKFQKGNLKTRMGDKDELLRMVAVLKANGLDVIQDLVLNHAANAGSNTGAGGLDPAAMDDGQTNRYKNFRYVSYISPADNETSSHYLARSGRFPKNWQNFYPNPSNGCCTNDINSPFWGPDFSYESNANGLSSNALFNPPQGTNFVRDQMRSWLIWYKKQCGWDGVRLDAVKHFPNYVTEDFLWNLQNNAGWSSQGSQMFAVGEWVGGAGDLDAWTNAVQNRAGTFDFALRNAITGLVQGQGQFDLGTAPSYQQSNRGRTVPFVNNHDTFRPQLNAQGNYIGWNTSQQLGPQVDPYDHRSSVAHALALSVDGAPQIFFEDLFEIGQNGNRWTHQPTSTSNLPVRGDIANLIWCHQNLNFKAGAYLVRWQAPNALVIERQTKALIAMNDQWSAWQNLTGVQTSWTDGTVLMDYSGANSGQVTVYGGGKVNLGIPPCDGSAPAGRKGYSVWAPVGSATQPYARPVQKTTQEWEMDNDLGDSHASSLQQGGKTPQQSLACRVVGRIFCQKDSIASVQVYLQDSFSSVNLDVLDQNCELFGQFTTTNGQNITFNPNQTGWYTLRILNLHSTQMAQKAWIKATYTAPQIAAVQATKNLCSCHGTGNAILTVVYGNAIQTPINQQPLRFQLGNEMVWSGRTGSTGQATAYGLVAGSYQLQWTDSLPWGGVNAADALAINRHFAATALLTGHFLKVADVNVNGSVNSTDALLVNRRFTGLLQAFPAGNWVFDCNSLPITSGSNPKTIVGLCVGDVNGSHTP